MTNVNPIGESNLWNKQLAEELDAADGKKDGKISASIWNNYMKSTGSSGNHIKNYISVDSAARSLKYYDAKKDTGKVDWSDWQNLLNIFKTKVPAQIDNSNLANIPEKADLPQNLAQERMHSDLPDLSNIDISKLGSKETIQGNDGKYYRYLLDDRVFIYDSKEQADKYDESLIIEFDNEHNMTCFKKFEYNEQGNGTVIVEYDAQGNLKEALEIQYNSDGKTSSDIEYDSNGEVDEFINYCYDDDENMFEYSYNKNGDILYSAKTDKNGIRYKYDQNGEFEYADKSDDKSHYSWDKSGKLEKD